MLVLCARRGGDRLIMTRQTPQDTPAFNWLIASVFVLAALTGCTISIRYFPAPTSYFGLGLAVWLALASYVDARQFLLLDVFTLPLLLAGLALAYFGYGPSVLQSAIGAAFGYLALWLVSALYLKVRGHHGLGMGDAKLLAAAGAWCGAFALPIVVLVGSFSALFYILILWALGRKIDGQFKLPFGPFLSLGFFVVWCLQLSTSASF